MYKLTATIEDIKTDQSLNIVSFQFANQILKMVSLELSENIQIGKKVSLSIKPNAVAIAKNIQGDLSYSNQIAAKVDSIDLGELLCSLKLSCGECYLESIITKESAVRIDVQEGDSVVALIKANEISISEVLD